MNKETYPLCHCGDYASHKCFGNDCDYCRRRKLEPSRVIRISKRCMIDQPNPFCSLCFGTGYSSEKEGVAEPCMCTTNLPSCYPAHGPTVKSNLKKSKIETDHDIDNWYNEGGNLPPEPDTKLQVCPGNGHNDNRN